MPWIAPPPLGSDSSGAATVLCFFSGEDCVSVLIDSFPLIITLVIFVIKIN
jgi:hypothetical protein